MLSGYLVPRYRTNLIFLLLFLVNLLALHFCVGINLRKDLHFLPPLQLKLSVIFANYTILD